MSVTERARRAFEEVRDLYNVKCQINVNDTILVNNGWGIVSMSESGVYYVRNFDGKIVQVYYNPITGNYKIHYDGNIMKVRSMIDMENALALMGIHIQLRICDHLE